MENNYLDQGVGATDSGLSLSGIDKAYLFTAAKWSRFIGIVGFVFTGLIAITLIFALIGGSNLFSLLGGIGGGAAGLGAFIFIFYAIILVINFLISLYLFNFGGKMKAALNNEDSDNMTEGFKNLKSYFSLTGILIAILVGIYALFFVIALFAGISAL